MNDALSDWDRKLLEVLQAAAAGDLTVRAPVPQGATAPMATALNVLLESVGEVLGRVARAEASIESVATDLSAAAARLGATAARQAACVTEVSRRMQSLETRSHEIDQVVELVDDIAAQTNMLALNAAIEASRSGEQGKGFAVVADEVRKLAERSSAATKDIAGFIEAIQSLAEETGRNVHDVRDIGGSLERSASDTGTAASRLTEAGRDMREALARCRIQPPRAALREQLQSHGPALLQALEPLATAAAGERSPVADAVRALLVAVRSSAGAR